MLLQRFLPLLQVAWFDQTVREYVCFSSTFYLCRERESVCEFLIFGFQFARCMRALLWGLFCKMVGRRKAHKYTAYSSTMLATLLYKRNFSLQWHYILFCCDFRQRWVHHSRHSLLGSVRMAEQRWPLFTYCTVCTLRCNFNYSILQCYPNHSSCGSPCKPAALRCLVISRPKNFVIFCTFHTKFLCNLRTFFLAFKMI